MWTCLHRKLKAASRCRWALALWIAYCLHTAHGRHGPPPCRPSCNLRRLEVNGCRLADAALHAFAMSPAHAPVKTVTALLHARASPDLRWPVSPHVNGQRALHLAAAGGLYTWDGDKDRPHLSGITGGTGESVAELLLRGKANPLARDAHGNLAAHLACATDDLAVVKLLVSHTSLHTFDGVYQNKRNLRPVALCPPNGKVVRYLGKVQQEAQARAKAAEERFQMANRVQMRIDDHLGSQLEKSVAELLGSPSEALRPGTAPTDEQPQAVLKGSDGGGGRGEAASKRRAQLPAPADQASGGVAGAGEGARVNTATADPTPATAAATLGVDRGRQLAAQLRFQSLPVQVAVTRHVLLQLALLDGTRRRTAMRTLHRIAAGTGERLSDQVPVDRDEPLYVTTLGHGSSGAIYCVWERSSKVTPFFEACGADAVRVWSVETSTRNLEEVGGYVERAWEYGRLAGEATSFPMGTTNELSQPGDTWHPVHAEDTGECSVPYIIKWYMITDTFSKLMLCTSDVSGEGFDLSQGSFHLPLLLDSHEQTLAAPVGPPCPTMLVGRSGTGKTSIALEIIYRAQEANAERVGEGVAARDTREAASGATAEEPPPAAQSHCNLLFLCKSKTLVSRVESHCQQLALPLGVRPTATDEVHRAFVAAEPQLPAPLFASSSEWLVLLDRCSTDGGRWFRSEKEEVQFVSTMNGTIDSLALLLDHDELDEKTGGGSVAVDENVGNAGGGGGRAGSGAAVAARHRKRQKAQLPERRSLVTFDVFAKLLEGHPTVKRISISSIYREV